MTRWLVDRYLYQRRETGVEAEACNFELNHGRVVLRGWVTNPGRDRALVYFGGNAERLDEMVDPLRQHFPGHTGYVLPYRGYGASDGRPSERHLVGDGVAIYDQAARSHGSVDVVGYSLGSAVAMQVAARRPVRRLVLVTPFDRLTSPARHLATGRYPPWLIHLALRGWWDSAAVAPRVKAECLVIIAGRDEVIPVTSSYELAQLLPRPAKVVHLPRAEHATVVDQRQFWPAVTAFLGVEP